MTLYGISGKAGHGKDTFSKAVVEAARDREEDFMITHFADPLKYQAIEIFGITEYDAFDTQGKETAFAQPINMDDYVDRMRKVTGLNIQAADLVARSPRELLQYYGTEYVRRVQDDYWIRVTLDQDWDNVLISDTRFPNEAKAIRAKGGKIVKVIRVDLPVSKDGHPSETSINLIEPDLVLYTRTGDFTRTHRMAREVARGNWGIAKELAAVYQAADLIRAATDLQSDQNALMAALDLLQTA